MPATTESSAPRRGSCSSPAGRGAAAICRERSNATSVAARQIRILRGSPVEACAKTVPRGQVRPSQNHGTPVDRRRMFSGVVALCPKRELICRYRASPFIAAGHVYSAGAFGEPGADSRGEELAGEAIVKPSGAADRDGVEHFDGKRTLVCQLLEPLDRHAVQSRFFKAAG